MLPVLVQRVVKTSKLSWKVVIFFENDWYEMLEVIEILLHSFFKRLVLNVNIKVHEFDFPFKRNADVVRSEIAMCYSHIVEKRINPQKLLDILVHVLGVALESIGFRVKSLRKVLNWLVVVSWGMYCFEDCSWKPWEIREVLLELKKKTEVGGER